MDMLGLYNAAVISYGNKNLPALQRGDLEIILQTI